MVKIDTTNLTLARLNDDIEDVLNQLLFLYYVLDYRPTKEELLKGCETALNHIFNSGEDGELEN